MYPCGYPFCTPVIFDFAGILKYLCQRNKITVKINKKNINIESDKELNNALLKILKDLNVDISTIDITLENKEIIEIIKSQLNKQEDAENPI